MIKHPKFGQKVCGIYGSDDNPTKCGKFFETIVRRGRLNPGVYYRLTDGEGKFWEYPADAVELINKF